MEAACPGILFANWYNNGMEIPVDEAEAKAYWDERLEKARKYAGTSQLLFMNGCDHQPVQKNFAQAIETARKLYQRSSLFTLILKPMRRL